VESSGTSRSGGVRYRYRSGDFLSQWMNSDELRAHAAEGRIRPNAEIQQIGKDSWVPASKVPGLWNAATPPHGLSSEPHVDAASPAAAPAPAPAREAHDEDTPAAHSGNGHHTRITESMQHLLQRALLAQVTVASPEVDQPLRAILAGVTADSIALEFEACATVVLVPWQRIRAIGLPSAHAHSTARIRGKAEQLVIEVEHLPATVGQAASLA